MVFNRVIESGEKIMAGCCSGGCSPSKEAVNPRYRKALWIALIINTLMFLVEIVGGLKSGSVSLLADAVDFAGDAANYAISLTVLSMGLLWRARAAWVKGASMGAYGLFVLGKTVWAAMSGVPPEPFVMGAIALVALVANLSVALMLYTFRDGDANMRSVWLCSRNDAIVNVAIALAALGVLGTETVWPDLLVAGIIAALALSASMSVIRQATNEINAATNEQTGPC